MNLIYLNSNASGIGDRLHDIILIYTIAKYQNYNNLYLHWIEHGDAVINDPGLHSRLRKEKTPFRSKDYLLHNLLTYLQFPDDIKFVSQQELYNLATHNTNKVITEYIGLTYSIITYIEKYFPSISEQDKNQLINSYYDNFTKIKFINIPQEIIDTFNNNDIITVHLRRGDKVADDGGTTNNIDTKDLVKLNNNTEEAINKYINMGYTNICFISDEKHVRSYFIDKFKNKCNIITFEGNDISQTYYDLYCLCKSRKNLLSQKFSVFSIIGTLIGKTELYYMFTYGKIFENKFNQYKTFHYYKS